ncbi:hypothetical protein BOTCAL_0010g00480 [Botryotinia calthae]|uniref:Uncharacterized protein n=1 Tax=Botryotinia calthae TaxID=38488 RepID=A0A4Y8DGN0_9HELO|nr:hypothetical protein BOTCAL_0010g00480 [Botryotinia calthae]
MLSSNQCMSTAPRCAMAASSQVVNCKNGSHNLALSHICCALVFEALMRRLQLTWLVAQPGQVAQYSLQIGAIRVSGYVL